MARMYQVSDSDLDFLPSRPWRVALGSGFRVQGFRVQGL